VELGRAMERHVKNNASFEDLGCETSRFGSGERDSIGLIALSARDRRHKVRAKRDATCRRENHLVKYVHRRSWRFLSGVFSVNRFYREEGHPNRSFSFGQ